MCSLGLSFPLLVVGTTPVFFTEIRPLGFLCLGLKVSCLCLVEPKMLVPKVLKLGSFLALAKSLMNLQKKENGEKETRCCSLYFEPVVAHWS